MVYAQPKIPPGKWDPHNSLGFSNTNESSNLSQPTRMKAYQASDVTVPADHSVRLKESEKKNNYQVVARKLKKIM